MPDALNAAYHAATQSVIGPAKQRIVANWENLMRHGLDQAAIQTFTDVSAPIGVAMQSSVANLTSAFLANRTGKKPLAPDPSKVLGRNDNPSSTQDAVAMWADTYARPFVQARSLVKNGMSLDDAVHRTAIRIALMVDTDSQMSKLRQAHESLRHYGATRYKRVNHPEASKTGTCALCLLASTQVYYVEDLLPIHTGCQCDVDLIQPGDITRINGRNYVGLSTLQIPEELMHMGERADPDSARSRIAGYLQDMDKRQFNVITEAWAQTVDVGYHPEIGPVLALKKTPVLNYDPSLPKPVHTVSIDLDKQPKLDVSQPVELSNLTDDEYGSGVQHINETIYETWSNVTFDEDKFEMRAGAQDAEWHGYQGMTQEQFDAIGQTGVTDNMYELYGKEIVAKAVWGDTTEDTLYRGIQMTFDDADTLKSWEGKEISMPLSSFTDVQGQGKNFATGHGWVSEDVPNGPTEPVVFELVPGARAAPISFNLGEEPDEYVSFGRFRVIGVAQEHDALHVQIEQTSMIEAQEAAKAASGAVKSIPEVRFLDTIAQAEESMAAAEKYMPIAFTDDIDTAIVKFENRWPTVELSPGTKLIAGVAGDDEKVAELVVETLKGVDDVLSKFPEVAVHLDEAGVAKAPPWALGATQQGNMRGDIAKTIMSMDRIARPDDLIAEVEDAVVSKFYHTGSEFYPAHSTMIHEMGHVLDFYTDMAASDEVPRVLRETFIETLPASVQDDARNGLTALSEMSWDFTQPFSAAEDASYDNALKWDADFQDWLRGQLSRGSFEPVIGADIDPLEVLAEAFQDVWMNGPDASMADRAVYDLLMRKVEGTTRVYRELGGAA